MSKFNKSDKVKLTHPNNIPIFNGFGNEWEKWWYDNINTIFIISFVAYNFYHLQYTNGDDVMNPEIYVNIPKTATFRDDELELYTNPLPDELFEL